ncbi:hypothetical protein [Cellulomonas sp. P5_E12]
MGEGRALVGSSAVSRIARRDRVSVDGEAAAGADEAVVPWAGVASAAP